MVDNLETIASQNYVGTSLDALPEMAHQSDVPTDDKQYIRKNKAWSEVVIPASYSNEDAQDAVAAALAAGTHTNISFSYDDVANSISATVTDADPFVEQDLATNATRYLTFVDSSTDSNQRLNLDTTLTYNPSSNTFGCGEIVATGNITAFYSDERMKINLGNINSPLDKVMKLNGFTYTNSELAGSFGYVSTEKQIGLSAQEVQRVLPEIVSLAPFDRLNTEDGVVSKSGENYLTVDYSRVVPLLVEAIKELNNKILILEGKN